MKTKLFVILFVSTLFTAGLSSCEEQEIEPTSEKEVKKETGAQASDDF